jgi:hypothetical protein
MAPVVAPAVWSLNTPATPLFVDIESLRKRDNAAKIEKRTFEDHRLEWYNDDMGSPDVLSLFKRDGTSF